jgi:3D (Asp-Asp-Asp) domain-containing protein
MDALGYARCMRYMKYFLMITVAGAMLCNGCARVRPPRGSKASTVSMEVTGYCKCKKCCGWKRTWYFKPVVKGSSGKRKKVGVTASGVKAKTRRTIAADKRYPFGTVMFVPGFGYGRVEDRGGAIQGNKIDLFFSSHKEALKWGRQKKTVRVWVPR